MNPLKLLAQTLVRRDSPLPEALKSVEQVVFDIRQLGTSPSGRSPLSRQIVALARYFPEGWRRKIELTGFARYGVAVAPEVAQLFDHLITAPPLRLKNALVIEPADGNASLARRKLRFRSGDGVRVLRCHHTALGAEEGANTDLDLVFDEAKSAQPHFRSGMIALESFLTGDAGAAAGAKDQFQELLRLRLMSAGRFVLVDPNVRTSQRMAAAIAKFCTDHAIQVFEFHDRDETLGALGAVRAPWDVLPDLAPGLEMSLIREAAAVFVRDEVRPQRFSPRDIANMGGRLRSVSDLQNGFDAHQEQNQKLAAASHLEPIAAWDNIAEALAKLPPETAIRRKRPLIAFLSAMPPEGFGPPVYSLEIVRALSEFADIDVWTGADMSPRDRKAVRRVHRFSEQFDAGEYDECVYVLGNHPIHASILSLMEKHGGTLILHDPQLYDLLRLSKKDIGLIQILSDELGREVSHQEMDQWCVKRTELPRPFLGAVLDSAKATIVHSPKQAEVLSKLYGAQVQYVPVAIQHKFLENALAAPAIASVRARLGIGDDVVNIGTFGEVHPIKGDLEFLASLMQLAEWGYRVCGWFVGNVHEDVRKEIERRADQWGLRASIQITGTLSEALYMDYLRAMDLCLQIRRMPFGQVSGALLDCVSAGLPGVATASLCDGIEAPDQIIRVPDTNSPVILAEQLANLIDAKKLGAQVTPAWRAYVRDHSFEAYGRRIQQLLFQ